MIDESYTMRCDGCSRYLQDEQKTMPDYGSMEILVAEARRLRWLVDDDPNLDDDRHWCPSCQQKRNVQP